MAGVVVAAAAVVTVLPASWEALASLWDGSAGLARRQTVAVPALLFVVRAEGPVAAYWPRVLEARAHAARATTLAKAAA